MKKALVVLVALVLVFSGCSGSGKKVVVNTMAYGDNANNEGISWVRIVDAFEAENPNIDIVYEMLYDEAYHNKVQARIASGDIPDMAFTGADARWAKPWKDAGLQYDHSKIIDDSVYDLGLIPDMNDQEKGKQIYEIPLGTSNLCTVLYMNEKLVKELGFSQPKTYDDMVAMVPAARKKGLQVVSIDGADGWAWGSCLMSMVIARMSGDAKWVSKAVVDKKNKFTDAAMVKSLSFLKQMVDDGVISKDSVLVDYGANISNFSNGKALFMVQGQWAAGGIENPEVADNTVMMTWPALPEEKVATKGCMAAAVQSGYGIINSKNIQKNKKVAEAAMTFLNYYYSEKETTQRLRDGAIVAPILKGYKAPADLPNIIKSKVALAQNISVECEVIDAFLSGAPNDALNTGMQEIVNGTKTPEEVAKAVQDLLK
ncbi:MAG: extracellular solute-binding protein [Spirochaetales bacterium]|nr:extracellular solute-binding protein [Spirochaetales bacterium]